MEASDKLKETNLSESQESEVECQMVLSGVNSFSGLLRQKNTDPRFLCLPSKPTTPEGAKDAMFQQFTKFRDEEFLCDVNLLPGRAKVPIKAHRFILSACFEYFHSMFSSGFKESTQQEVRLPSVSKTDMKMMVEFAYTGDVDIKKENALKLAVLANYLGSDNLVAQTTDFILQFTDVNNCTKLLKFAYQYDLLSLKKSLVLYAVENLKKVLEASPELSELPVDVLLELAEHPAANLSSYGETNERQLFLFIWPQISKLSQEDQATYIPKLLKAIHLPQIENDFLTYIESKEGHIPGVKELMEEAKKDVDPAETREWYLKRFLGEVKMQLMQQTSPLSVDGEEVHWYSRCFFVEGLPWFFYKTKNDQYYVSSPVAIQDLGLPYKVEVVVDYYCGCTSSSKCTCGRVPNWYHNGKMERSEITSSTDNSVFFRVRFCNP